jgi:hypothetical protein
MSVDIDAIRERHEKSTPGTEGRGGNAGWYTGEPDYLEIVVPIYRDGPNSVESLGGMYILADAEFVAAAHQDVPALCDELEVTEGLVRELAEILSDSICHICDNRLGYEPGHTCCAEQRQLLARVPERLRK